MSDGSGNADYAAWYAAAVSTVLAVLQWREWRRKGTSVLVCYARWSPQPAGSNIASVVKAVVQNRGGVPTTLDPASARSVLLPRWTLGLSIFARSGRFTSPTGGGGLAIPFGNYQNTKLASPTDQVEVPLRLNQSEFAAMQERRLVLMIKHSAVAMQWDYVRVIPEVHVK